MNEYSTPVKPDKQPINGFAIGIYLDYLDYLNNPRVDILMENTGFGVGE